jgi:serine/threonine protein kinase
MMGDQVVLRLEGQRGSYSVGRKIGEGSFGEVFHATTKDGQRFAVKILRESYNSDQERRFTREIKIQLKLKHPNILPILDWGRDSSSRLFYIMPFVAGGTLAEVIKRNRTWLEVLSLVSGVAKGLAAYHAKGGIHRDVKLENILIDAGGVPMLADFGVAACPTLTGSNMTRSGLGTECYMAPEVWKNQACDRSDIYALGIVLSELTNGRRHDVPNVPPRLVQAGADIKALQLLYSQMTDTDPGKRPSAEFVASQCDAIAKAFRPLERAPMVKPKADPLSWLVGSAVVVGLLALLFGKKK